MPTLLGLLLLMRWNILYTPVMQLMLLRCVSILPLVLFDI